ncbi:2-C-methyl-D-erythritol 4-phosphate cytidylyltransferase [Nitrosomonadales bacterium]|nr:2-C-methyl-D-erythritol 4-phosphate cytidylyltransferase [Nitrosomonadales bacterium]
MAITLGFDKKQQITYTEKRDEIWLAQTPQMFRFNLLKRALTSFKGDPTDESEAIEALGLSPKVVKGSLENFGISKFSKLCKYTCRGVEEKRSAPLTMFVILSNLLSTQTEN